MPDSETPAAPGFDYVVTAEFGDHQVGEVLADHPGEDHAHRVVRRAVAPTPAPQES